MTGSDHMQVQATLSLYSVPQRPPAHSANGGLVKFYNKETGIRIPMHCAPSADGCSQPFRSCVSFLSALPCTSALEARDEPDLTETSEVDWGVSLWRHFSSPYSFLHFSYTAVSKVSRQMFKQHFSPSEWKDQ